MKTPITEIKAHAAGRWLSIIHALAPQLSPAYERPGRHVPCPIHGGTDGFRLFNDVAETGGGICNTCGAFADGFDLLEWINGWTFPEAVDAVTRFLGKCDGYAPPKRTIPQPAPKKDWGSQRKWLQRLWDEATPNHPRLKQYICHRVLSIDPPPSLRLHEGLKYFDDKKQSLGVFPCMFAEIIRDFDNVGLHVTFLDPSGPGKANVPSPKKIWKCADTVSGGSIRLFDPEPDKPLAVAEGIETALAIREISGIPVWACGNAVLLEQVEITEAVDSIYIGADKDKSETGKLAACNLAERLFKKGHMIKISLPPMEIPEGKKSVDWNDYVAQEKEATHG